ncbi:MAG: hypothetical protein J7J98_07670 [candidate division Zixibacteria bacterium]|nr:hypothetical protein [candidate division Zixibacteria bacterium]
MKILRVAIAVVITLAMLYTARTNSCGQTEFLAHADGEYSFEINTVPKINEYQSDRVTVGVFGPLEGKQVVFRTSQFRSLPADQVEDFDAVVMQPVADTLGLYYTEITAGEKSNRFYYYFEVQDSTGLVVATFKTSDESPFYLRYIGVVPTLVLLCHLFFIFSAVFAVAMATVHAFRVVSSGEGLKPMAKYLFWAMVLCFFGCYPFGIPMNWYAFGVTWEGVPFGTDATDNKTQLMFVYLVFASLSTWGSFRNGRGRDLFAPKTLGVIGLGSFVVMLFIYLIPHSIQFEPTFTYAFCYTWIAIVAALYLLGRLRVKAAG